jgi:hypothetical protein
MDMDIHKPLFVDKLSVVIFISFIERHNILETCLTKKPGPTLLAVRAAEQQVMQRLRLLRT